MSSRLLSYKSNVDHGWWHTSQHFTVRHPYCHRETVKEAVLVTQRVLVNTSFLAWERAE